MTTSEIRELTDAELNDVSGGNLSGWQHCTLGTTSGGSDGLYPQNVTCAGGTWGDLVQIIVDTANKGKQIQQQYGGGGRPM